MYGPANSPENKCATRTSIIGWVLVGGITLAEYKTSDPDVNRKRNLDGILWLPVGRAGWHGQGRQGVHAGAAEAAKHNLIAVIPDIAAKFETNVGDPDSHSKRDVWTNWSEFVAVAANFGRSAATLDLTSLDGIRPRLGAISGARKD